MSLLVAESLHYTIDSQSIVKNFNISIDAAEIVALVGPSGSGKTSILHMLGGLLPPTMGNVSINSEFLYKQNICQDKLRINYFSYIFQDHHLLVELNAFENVAIPLWLAGNMDRVAIKKKVDDILQTIGMQNKAHSAIDTLSGGEKQRLAIARELVMAPKIVLADEPTGNLDQHNASIVFQVLQKLCAEQCSACVIVTHDMTLAKLAHRQILVQ